MAKKPEIKTVFGMEIGMNKTARGTQVVIVDRSADRLFVLFKSDSGDCVFAAKVGHHRVNEDTRIVYDKAADRFFKTGEWSDLPESQEF